MDWLEVSIGVRVTIISLLYFKMPTCRAFEEFLKRL